MLTIELLPARQGDAIWITWGDEASPHRMMIDMGTEGVGKAVRERILALPEASRRFDLLVITHVDRDHIGGVLTCLAEADPVPGLRISDVWFNGFQHLNGEVVRSSLEPMGPAQGERLSAWLRGQAWNKEFRGGPVQRVPEEEPPTVTLHDGLKLTILGPTPDRLKAFIPKWKEEVQKALEKGTLTEVSPGLEAMGPKVPPILETPQDLELLAETHNTPDGSEANGSSIALMLEYDGKRVILAGDAFSGDLVAAIESLGREGRLAVDAFKLPHHGSKKNVFRDLVESVDCQRWVFSTDGTQFRHPDPVALARVVTYSTVRPPHVAFNVPSKFNGWWDNDDWRAMYGYTTEYGSGEQGLTLSLD
jgi:beta-lactamase superfamily II metal-dependent hydrolase